MRSIKRLSVRSLALAAAVVLAAGVACQSEYKKHYNLAKDLKDQERYEEAIQEYELAAKADPSSAKPYYRIGQIHKKQDKQAEAAEYFRKAIEVEPDYVDAYPELVKALQRAGDLDRATQVAKDALAKPVVRREMSVVKEIEDQMLEIENQRKAKTMQKQPPLPGTAPPAPSPAPVGASTPTVTPAGSP